MFKKAYVRGITKALIDCGAVKFASEEDAVAAADQVAERLPEQPVDGVPPDATAELAVNLIELSNAAAQAATSIAGAGGEGGAGGGAPSGSEAGGGAPPEAAVKSAAAILRKKLAVDTGSTIVGTRPEQENRPENSTNAEAKLDALNRPGGDSYANVGEDGVGKQQASGEGALGSEKKRTDGTGMGPAEGGSNSATEAVKSAGILRLIRAAAMGKTADVPGATIDGAKSFPDATTGEGALEIKRRPAGYAVEGVDRPGESAEAAKERASQVGTQQPHPDQPKHEGGTNTAIKQSEDEEYIRELRLLGQKYASRLPFYMQANEKVAALQYLKGLPPSEREGVMHHIEKTAEIPEGLKDYIASKKGEGDGEKKDDHEKSETKTEEKKEEGKKEEGKKEEKEEKKASVREADTLARLRRLS